MARSLAINIGALECLPQSRAASQSDLVDSRTNQLSNNFIFTLDLTANLDNKHSYNFTKTNHIEETG